MILFQLLGGCAGPIKGPVIPVAPTDFPSFRDDMNFDGLEHSIVQSLNYLDRLAPGRTFRFGDDFYDVAHMKQSLTVFSSFIRTAPTGDALRNFIAENYRVYRSIGGPDTGRVLFTGYYEPILQGSIEESPEYPVPVWSRPTDLMAIDLSPFSEQFNGQTIIGRLSGDTVVPYHDRKEIDQEGVLQGKATPLVWVKDTVDLFFLQIQGSGKVYLNNGTAVNIHYHAANGRPYRSIGKLLIDREKIPREKMSMQAIRDYLENHPQEVEEILNANPSYVFFKTEEEGPLGCLNVKLTPGRSLALERRIFPEAALAFIETEKPLPDGAGNIQRWVPFSRFVLNQDTGGAIRGPGRADLFWGNGPYAEIAAGHMQQMGTLYFLILKPREPDPPRTSMTNPAQGSEDVGVEP